MAANSVECPECGILNMHLRKHVCDLCGASLWLQNAVMALTSMSPGRVLNFVLWSIEYLLNRIIIRELKKI